MQQVEYHSSFRTGTYRVSVSNELDKVRTISTHSNRLGFWCRIKTHRPTSNLCAITFSSEMSLAFTARSYTAWAATCLCVCNCASYLVASAIRSLQQRYEHDEHEHFGRSDWHCEVDPCSSSWQATCACWSDQQWHSPHTSRFDVTTMAVVMYSVYSLTSNPHFESNPISPDRTAVSPAHALKEIKSWISHRMVIWLLFLLHINLTSYCSPHTPQPIP